MTDKTEPLLPKLPRPVYDLVGTGDVFTADQLRAYALDAVRLNAPGWREIASAPRDGTEIILLFHSRIFRIGAWLPYHDGSYPQVWQDSTGSVLVRPWKDDANPTAWQPLPSPPVGA